MQQAPLFGQVPRPSTIFDQTTKFSEVAVVAAKQQLLGVVVASHQILHYAAALSAQTTPRPVARIVCHSGYLRTE
jgi:hypothetical protein